MAFGLPVLLDLVVGTDTKVRRPWLIVTNTMVSARILCLFSVTSVVLGFECEDVSWDMSELRDAIEGIDNFTLYQICDISSTGCVDGFNSMKYSNIHYSNTRDKEEPDGHMEIAEEVHPQLPEDPLSTNESSLVLEPESSRNKKRKTRCREHKAPMGIFGKVHPQLPKDSLSTNESSFVLEPEPPRNKKRKTRCREGKVPQSKKPKLSEEQFAKDFPLVTIQDLKHNADLDTDHI